MGYSLVAISMMILYALALIYREIFSKVLGVFFYMFLHVFALLFSCFLDISKGTRTNSNMVYFQMSGGS